MSFNLFNFHFYCFVPGKFFGLSNALHMCDEKNSFFCHPDFNFIQHLHLINEQRTL